jgi:hypothetical protein
MGQFLNNNLDNEFNFDDPKVKEEVEPFFSSELKIEKSPGH